MAILRPVNRSQVAKQSAAPPAVAKTTPVPLPSAVPVKGKPTQLVGKMGGSASNSADPHGDMLHPTDRKAFNANRFKGKKR